MTQSLSHSVTQSRRLIDWLAGRLTAGLHSHRDLSARIRGEPHSRERDRQAIAYHYELPGDFFSLWLDRWMGYSCAIFSRPEEDLDAAQENKLACICEKLELKPGLRLLDLGCGWGGLVIYAASHYGVEARGITLSPTQARFASARIDQAGLTDRCQVDWGDYQDCHDLQGYDRLASVEMYEHIGAARLPEYFKRTWSLLRPGGLFLLQESTCRPGETHTSPFALRYVFPDGELVPVHTLVQRAQESGFELLRVESLSRHYPLTLRHMVRRLEACHKEASCMVGETTYRIWRLYLSAAAHRFSTGQLSTYQILLRKPCPEHSRRACPERSRRI